MRQQVAAALRALASHIQPTTTTASAAPAPDADRAGRVRAEIQAALGRMERRPKTLTELCSRYGVRPPLTFEETPALAQASLVEFDREAFSAALGPRLEFGPARTLYTDAIETREVFARATEWGELVEPHEVHGPGTLVVSGLPATDPAARFSPYLARGVCSHPGHYEAQLRNPLVARNVTSLTEGLTEAAWSVSPPRRVPKVYADRARDMADWVAGWLTESAWWPTYVEHAASALAFGFAAHELVWDLDEAGRPYVRDAAYREQAIVDRWLFDGRGRHLLGAAFRSTGDTSAAWSTTARGLHVVDHRLVVATYRGRGNNVEGTPPGRTLDVLLVLWELLWKIAGACYERFASPILTARYDAALLALPGKTPDAGEVEVFLDYLSILTALDTPTLELPLGLLAEYVGPGGEMPDVLPLIERIEATVDRAYATQAMGLGQRSAHGSYALASVQDNDYLRAIPSLGRTVARPFNLPLARLAVDVWKLPATYAPRIDCVPDADVDASAWIGDALSWHEAAPTMPPELRARGLELLGVPSTIYDDAPDHLEQVEQIEAAPAPEQVEQIEAAPADENIQTQFLNGAQVAEMRGVVEAVAAGTLPAASAVQVLRIAYRLTPDEAEAMIAPARERAAADAAARAATPTPAIEVTT